MINQPNNLIQILLNEEASYGDRHDAAMDLGSFDAVNIEAALARIACDDAADEDLADACGESLAEIWCRKGRVSKEIFSKLSSSSLKIALAMLKTRHPNLAAEAESMLDSVR